MKRIFVAFILMMFAQGASAVIMPKDSVGVSQKEDKRYILHKVVSGEGLYSISRKYNVSIEEIKKANPSTSDGLVVGEVLNIPFAIAKSSTKSEAKTVTASLEISGNALTHEVKAGETLFSISRKYSVPVAKLVQANGLEDNPNIKVGQKLNVPVLHASKTVKKAAVLSTSSDSKVYHLVKAGETMFSLSRAYGITVDELKNWNNLSTNTLSVGDRLIVGNDKSGATEESPKAVQATAVQPRDYKSAVNTNPENRLSIPISVGRTVDASGKVTEVGVAEIMDGSDDTNKYLGLHRSAPVGTIIQVKNDMTKHTVFVRIIGRLPDTGINEKTLIRISKKAYERLGGKDYSFPVELTYIESDIEE
ncbi:LysM peptidoglycan-binding domain-containing protein [Aureibacter tunicatorum]|uniref:LysM repeat protein n=1 Tax=Aureibacter tunicatorum TaxID=866807 RepID=A0AAE3XLM7_9BACT|nr:LysM peptidoglycan-binding domain-containing protein [Aureibacter tunicatorum]MDR6238283.1 LysM repeat protein [Aureibacter tunicatorum]BDD03316.1 hypothetical protein AUTU_07990 [Aureibacter tunicatorum]